jgi:hypothetical protein
MNNEGLLMSGLLSIPALAKDKPIYSYQSAVLLSFHSETTGTRCTGSADTDGTVDANTNGRGTKGTVQSTTSESATCSDRQRVLYTVKVGETTIVFAPYSPMKREGGGLIGLGWNKAFAKDSVLASQLPGATLQIRSDGKLYYVKVAERESAYTVVGAQ